MSFIYSPITGHLYYEGRPKPAGSINNYGYRIVKVNGKPKKAHRVIWEMVTGETIPQGMVVDHIDGDRDNNAWHNLRLASPRLNRMNSSKHSCLYKDERVESGWKVVVDRKYIGYFTDYDEAVRARDKAREDMLRSASTPWQEP